MKSKQSASEREGLNGPGPKGDAFRHTNEPRDSKGMWKWWWKWAWNG